MPCSRSRCVPSDGHDPARGQEQRSPCSHHDGTTRPAQLAVGDGGPTVGAHEAAVQMWSRMSNAAALMVGRVETRRRSRPAHT